MALSDALRYAEMLRNPLRPGQKQSYVVIRSLNDAMGPQSKSENDNRVHIYF